MLNNNFFKVVLAFILALLVTFGFSMYKLNVQEASNKLYKQGMILFNNKKYQDAYFNFSQIKKTSSLYEMALLKQFQCADKLNDKKTALAKIALLSKKTDDETIRPYILYNELTYNLQTKKYSNSQLASKFEYIQKTYPNSDFAMASAYRIAKIEKSRNVHLAKNKFIEYLKYAPSGKYSADALSEVTKLNTFLSEQDRIIISNIYLANNNFQAVSDILKTVPFELSWINLAKAYRGLKKYELERKTILEGLNLKKSPVAEKEISLLVDRLISITNTDKKQSLSLLYDQYQNTVSEATIAYKLASLNKNLLASKIYEKIVTKHPNSNSLWEVFWFNYSQRKYNVALAIADKYIEKYPKSDDIARISYWRARTLLKLRQNSEAKTAFYDVIAKFPLTYYAFASARQLKISKVNKVFIKKPVVKYNIESINNKLFAQNKLLLTLIKYNDFETIEDLKIDNEYIKAYLLNKKSFYPESIVCARKQLQVDEKFSSFALKLAYPIVYEDLINRYALKHEISPYLFLSLIKEESHFNKNALSSAGAFGLAQLMKPTADYIEKRSVSKEELLNPEENLAIASKYFAYLIDLFKGNIYLSILAYNAGHGNVQKWLSNSEIYSKDIDEFIENVPYNETKTYIKKILSSYWIYINAYSNMNL